VDPCRLRAGYLDRFAAFCRELRERARGMGVDYHLLRTDEPVDHPSAHPQKSRRDALGRHAISRSRPAHSAADDLGRTAADGGLAANAAKQWAMALIDGLGANDRVAVIRAGLSPRVIAPLAADHDAARSAIQALPVPRGGCNGPAAVALARQLLGDRAGGEPSI